jgi:AcrR family transcriptional regulator
VTTTTPHLTADVLTEEQRAHVEALFRLVAGSDTLDVRVADVVREAGSCNAAFYRAFSSKDELLLAGSAENARRTAELIWSKVADAATPAEIVSTYVTHILKLVANPRLARAAQAFALDRHRLGHRYPESAAAHEAVMNAPLSHALELARIPQRELVEHAIAHMVLGFQTSFITAGVQPKPRRIKAVVSLCLTVAGIPQQP